MKEPRTSAFEAELKKFISLSMNDPAIQHTVQKKLQHTSQILDGELRIGGVAPRGPKGKSKKTSIGAVIRLSPDHLRSESRPVIVMSAKTNEDSIYEKGIEHATDFPGSSTRTDRRQIKNFMLSGFSRTNVPSTADMNSCSLMTCRDFLIYAEEKLDNATFALIWVVTFLGLSHRRLFIESRTGCRHPLADEILVDAKRGAIIFNIIRRCRDRQDGLFEVCGRMYIPVDQRIIEGLLEICRLGTQESCIASALRGARNFSKNAQGQRPTLPRLRASNAIQLARLGLTELEVAAVRGRVPPAIFGISSYYPHTVSEICAGLKRAYERAIDSWCLPSSLQLKFGEVPSIEDTPIYCKISRGKALVANLLGTIGAGYANLSRSIRGQRTIHDPTPVLDALNLQELGVYMLQELGIGLRPVGDVAQASMLRRKHGAITKDKASRLYSERSYSPVSTTHEAVLKAREQNRSIVRSVMANFGIPFTLTEPNSDLAMRYHFDPASRSIIGTRIRGADFREFTSELPTMLLGTEEQNWLRHVSAELVGSQVPRWQSDEFHGHKVIGREPFGPWSTVSIADFDSLAMCLDALHEEIVPAELLQPIALWGDDF